MLTKNDLKQIREIVTESVGTVVDIKLVAIKDEISQLKDQIKFLPTRDEYLTEADKIYGELKSVREAIEIQSSYKDQLEDHESRIGKLETLLY